MTKLFETPESPALRKLLTSRELVILFFKGMAMGAADVVPGVSGGTIAFVSGIYQRLIDAIKSLEPRALSVLYRQGFSAFWKYIDGTFLSILFAGILTSVLSLAKIISYCLDQYPILVWSFFFGLVLASIVYIFSQLRGWNWREICLLIMGTIIALAISSVKPTNLPAEWWMLMLSGSIAICAMILPGISGSFILLMMGMYSVFINALKNFEWVLLGSFAAGCAIGLMIFSHLLSWLLKHYENLMLALLTGFLVGSLKTIWPWKEVIETTINRHGERVPFIQQDVSPFYYAQVTGEPHQLFPAILMMVIGIVLVLGLEKLGDES